ncbi:MAG: biotin--[acetyl-CoA-carboxylase] ligase [Planctomycetes bacterium]|nr:biotin--[acetyl-CoA-carboxylase] ligase [Planctomycetota bacterium]
MNPPAPEDACARAAFERTLRLAAGSLSAELELVHLAQVDSTNSWALDREQRAESTRALLVIADEQRAGRGQHGRSWFAFRERSLALSYVPRPAQRDLDAPRLSMSAAVAAREVLSRFLPRAPRLKWPNDLLVEGCKLAGILVESRWLGARRVGPVLGIGVNLGVTREEFPPELRELATSIAIAGGCAPERASLAGALAMGFERWLERSRIADGRELAVAYLEGLELRGRRVEVATAAGPRCGVCLDLDLERGLHLREEGAAAAVPLAQITALRELGHAGPAASATSA